MTDEQRKLFLEHNPIAVDQGRDREAFNREVRRIKDWLPTGRTLTVCDFGCGAGAWTGYWLELGARVVAMDFDLDLVRTAAGRLRVRAGGRMLPAVGDAGLAPFRSARFDLVSCDSVLEHTPHWREVVQEAARLVAPGGVLVLHTTNRLCPMQTEVRGFPFYPWLPDGLRDRVLAWIMKHQPERVGYSATPAVNWFHPRVLRDFVAAQGLEVYERIDLVRPEELHGVRALGRWMVSRNGHGGRGRLLYYLMSKSVSLYARRPAAG